MQTNRPISRQKYLIGLLIVALSILVWLITRLDLRAMFYPPIGDFLTYWVSAKLHLAGQNPYDPELMASAQWEMGQRFDLPTLVYNPPWTFALLSAFAIWPYPVARSLWLVASLIIMFAAGHLSWQLYSDDRRLRWVGWALALTFTPALVAARIGQITPFILGGVVLFLLFIQKQKWGWAGAAAAFIAIKPQLIYLFWPALLLWVIVEKRWSVIIGLAAALLASTAVAMLTNPAIVPQFIVMVLYNPPAQFTPPTWGTALRLYAGLEQFWVQFAVAVNLHGYIALRLELRYDRSVACGGANGRHFATRWAG